MDKWLEDFEDTRIRRCLASSEEYDFTIDYKGCLVGGFSRQSDEQENTEYEIRGMATIWKDQKKYVKEIIKQCEICSINRVKKDVNL